MNIKILLLVLLVSCFSLKAQVKIGDNPNTKDPSAVLHIESNNKGILVPRMTASQRTAITSPANGLMVYQTDGTPGFYFYNSSAWTSLNGTNGQGVPTGGTANQVLAKIDGTDYNTTWVSQNTSAAGAKVDLVVTKTVNAQILPLANGTNTGDVVTFDNVVTTPTLGSYSSSTNSYTVGITGVYIIQAVTRCNDATVAGQTVGQFLFVDVDGAGISSINTLIADYPPPTGTNFPSGVRGKGFTNVTLYLTAGQTVRILGLGANATTATQPLQLNQSCKFMIFKL